MIKQSKLDEYQALADKANSGPYMPALFDDGRYAVAVKSDGWGIEFEAIQNPDDIIFLFRSGD